MTKDIVNNMSAVDDMLADLNVDASELAAIRAVLDDISGLAGEMPEPSAEVRALLGGAVPLRPRRRTALVAAAVGALALGGVSGAAAANRLPDPIQEIVADAADGVLPAGVPHPAHPVKPVNPPFDAPGHVRNKPKTDKHPTPTNTTAPGQIQKATKPDPGAPGPASPANPGSFGRAHNADKVNSGSSDDSSDSDSHRGKGDDSDSEDSDTHPSDNKSDHGKGNHDK